MTLGNTAAPAVNPLEPLLVDISEGCRLTGLGTTTIYKLIAERKLDKVKVGRRTLLVYESLKRLATPDVEGEQ
jgi:excisionase family DNA binding protein